SFIVASIIALFTGLSYAELSSIYPKSAAEYVFAKNVFRSHFIALVVGCLIIFVAVASAATVALGFSGYLTSAFFPQFNPILVAVVLVAALSFVNFYGIVQSVWMNTTFTFIELAGLAIIILAGFWFGSPNTTNYFEMPDKMLESSETSLLLMFGAIFGGAGLIFFAYYGFENIVNIADETKNPVRVIPKALLISIAVTTAFYILIAITTSALVGWKALSLSEAPLSLAAEKAFGGQGVIILSLIALFATSNTALMMLISGSRIIYGISKDQSFPKTLAVVHKSRETPWVAIIIVMVSTMTIVAWSSGDIATIAGIAVFGIFLVYAIVNLSLIWSRFKNPSYKRPFTSPIRIGRFPVLAGMGLITSITMLFQFDIYIIFGGFLVLLSIAVLSVFLIKIKK
ncbi:MAG TPA: APC family permease, partial [Nitrososphaeraceae archaeon]|nr:APC family permease [Nitrososphaeraceae archaeon]